MHSIDTTKPTGNGLTTGGRRGSWQILSSKSARKSVLLVKPLSMTMSLTNAMVCLLVVLSLHAPAFSQQNPCSEDTRGCRPLIQPEIEGLKERFLALRAAVPVPDPGRWAIPDGVDEAYTMPFIAELKSGGTMICLTWPGGCFPEETDLDFVYDAVKKGEPPVDKPRDTAEQKDPAKALEELAASAQQILADFANRIEIGATLLPHAYLVDEVNGKCVDVTETDAVTIENTPTFLVWQSGDGTHLTMVFGPRTCKEDETLCVEKPAKALAPVKSIVLEVTGPNEAEVAALKQKIDRKAFEALLGDVVK